MDIEDWTKLVILNPPNKIIFTIEDEISDGNCVAKSTFTIINKS